MRVTFPAEDPGGEAWFGQTRAGGVTLHEDRVPPEDPGGDARPGQTGAGGMTLHGWYCRAST